MKLLSRVTMPEGAIYNITPEGGAKFKSASIVEVINSSEQEMDNEETEAESNSPMVVG